MRRHRQDPASHHRARTRRPAWQPGWAALVTAALALAPVAGQEPAKPEPAPPPAKAAVATAPAPAAPVELPEVVVTATRVETPKERVGGSVTVITAAEIECRQPGTVEDLLRTVPGVTVVNQGGPGRLSNVMIRGANSADTLVLLDGVRVNSLTAGGFDFSLLQPGDVERIEVLRGPQNTLYGSDASGGVISIVTRRAAKGTHVEAMVEGGEPHDFSRERASVAFGDARLDYWGSLEQFRTCGPSAAWDPAGAKDNDAATAVTFAQRLGLNFLDDGRLDLVYRQVNADTDLDAGPATDDRDFTQVTFGRYGSVTASKDFASWWRQKVSYGRAREEYESDDPTDTWRDARIHTDSQQYTTQSDFRWHPNDTLSAGYTYETRAGAVEGNYRADYRLHSGFAENQLALFDAVFFTVGGRYDDFADFGHAWTGRGALAVKLGDTRLHGSYGNGFRIPTLNDLLWPVDPLFGGGNPALKPEHSVGGDVGVEQAWSDRQVVVDVTYFENRYRDLIVWENTDPANPWFWQPANVEQARLQGVETTLAWQVWTGLKLNAAHTYTDSENFADSSRLPRRPLNQYALGLTVAARDDKLSGSLTMVAVRDRVETTGAPMDNYERWDAAVSYAVTPHVKPHLRVENVFDANYEETTGYTSPGVAVYAGVTASW